MKGSFKRVGYGNSFGSFGSIRQEIVVEDIDDVILGTDVEYYDKDGKLLLTFRVNEFPAQCGASILHTFEFETSKKDWWEEFTADLREWSRGKVAKLVASAVNPRGSCKGDATLLHALLTNTGWEHGSNAKNPNSGNVITIFELTV